MRALLERQGRGVRSASLTLGCAAGVAVVALVARVPGAVRNAFWQDEVASARVLLEPTPWEALRRVARVEATPPLWYAIGWVAHQLGLSPTAYRGLSVLAGALLAGAVVLFAVRSLPLWAAAVAGLLVALGWQFLAHGRELRAYELFALLAVVFALVLHDEACGPAGSRWRRWGLVGVIACGSLTSYFFCLSLAAGLAWVWTEPGLRPRRRELTLLAAAGLVPLALWSPALVNQYTGQRFAWIGPFEVQRALDAPLLVFVRDRPEEAVVAVLAGLAALAAVAGGCAVLARMGPHGRLVAFMALVPFALAVVAWALGARVFHPRNLLGAGPFMAIAVVALIARAPRAVAWAAAAAVAGALAVAAVAWERDPGTQYDEVADALVAAGWTPADPIVLVGDFFAYRGPLEWSLPGRPALTLAEPRGRRRCPRLFVVVDRDDTAGRVLRTGRVRGGREAGDALVGRLAFARPPERGLWRRSRLVAAVEGRPACVTLVPEGGIVERLR